jgi:hypothetical protein
VGDAIPDHILIRPVFEDQGDEGGLHVVVLPVPPAKRRQVLLAPPLAAVVVAAERFARARAAPFDRRGWQRDNQIIRARGSPHHRRPATELPLREHRGERRVNGDVANGVGLRRFLTVLARVVGPRDKELAERFDYRVVVPPAKPSRLAGAQAREQLQAVGHLPIGRDPRIGDQCLRLVAREHRAGPPLGVLVAQWTELPFAQHAR